MATTGKVNGTLLKIYIDGTAIGATTSHSLSWAMETREATTKDSSGDEEVLEGLVTKGMSFDGLAAWDESYGFEELMTAAEARSAVTAKISTEVVGDPRYSFSAYITSLEMEAGTEETITFSGELQGTGALTTETVT